MLNNDIRTPINILRPSEIVKFHPAAELLAAEICFINFPGGQLISFYLLTFTSPPSRTRNIILLLFGECVFPFMRIIRITRRVKYCELSPRARTVNLIYI